MQKYYFRWLKKMVMDKIRISAVRYANTYPFIYGLKESGFSEKIILELDHPADCAAKLIGNKADIVLIPVGALPALKDYRIITDYCIGANGHVRTVMLLFNCAFEDIDTIYLDYRSRTSVNLVKVLAENWWKKKIKWVNTAENFDFLKISCNEAVVLIGDQCIEFEGHFSNGLDLSMEWKNFTGLPFVFACWATNKPIENSIIDELNAALKTGVTNIDKVVTYFSSISPMKSNILKTYLTENINFVLDTEKKRVISLFLSYMNNLGV
jgi:chorismate dehydratase